MTFQELLDQLAAHAARGIHYRASATASAYHESLYFFRRAADAADEAERSPSPATRAAANDAIEKLTAALRRRYEREAVPGGGIVVRPPAWARKGEE